MKNKQLLVGLAAVMIALSGGVHADEIYKWIDEDGNVHYEDRPSGMATEEILQLSYNRTNSGAVQDRVQTRRDNDEARRQARDEVSSAKQSAADERAAAEEKRTKCQNYRKQMQTMLEARRLYREDANGERVYLDDAARAAAREKTENLIKDYCGN